MKKRLLSLFLIIIVVFTFCSTVYADPGTGIFPKSISIGTNLPNGIDITSKHHVDNYGIEL